MKQRILALVVLLEAAACLPLRAEDFRVEWVSGKTLALLAAEAGREPLRICPSSTRSPCLFVKPGEKAQCISSRGAVECATADGSRRSRSLALVSAAPFRLEAQLGKSGTSQPSRAITVRTAEIRAAHRGPRVIIPLDPETYVTGVLVGEASTLQSGQALAALAVLARTWALRSRGRHRKDGYDFCCLTHCQAFSMPSENGIQISPALAEAARKTSREVLMYRGELADSYFGADCGGATEAAGNLWPDRAQPYLRSIADPYCAASEHSYWQREISLSTISAILRENMGVALAGPLRDFEVDEKDSSGRAQGLRAVGGTSQRIDANAFRYAANRQLGWNTLKSNLYRLERRDDSIVFIGRGLGHGVGLCQAGADQMGRLGIPYEKILAMYFSGTEVARAAPTYLDPVLSSEHFEIFFPERERRWVDETLQALETSRRRLGERAEGLPSKVRVETWSATVEFIRATNQPGWVGGSNDGRSIALQPLSKLKTKGILNRTLQHELAHLVVRRRRAPGVPAWFEEGLVLCLTREDPAGGRAMRVAGRTLEESVLRPRSEDEMKAAYARALERVRKLARARGEAALWEALEHPTDADRNWFKEGEHEGS